MFKKAFKVQQQTKLRTSDGRKLRQRAAAVFGLDEDGAAALLPTSAGVSSSRVPDLGTTIYFSGDEPVLFEDAARDQPLVPTLYALWRVPSMLGEPVVIHDPVLGFLIKGADLMLPGVASGLDPAGPWAPGDLRCVCVEGSASAVAIGRIACTKPEAAARKGKALEVIHLDRDFLWALGPRTGPADRQQHQSIAAAPASPEPSAEAPEATEAPADPRGTAEMDALLEGCLLHAVKRRLTPRELPVLASALLAAHLLPSRPPGAELDVRRTSYKKLSRFLQAMQAQGVVTLDEQDGVVRVVGVNRDCERVRAYEPRETQEDADRAAAAALAPADPRELVEVLYTVPERLAPLVAGAPARELRVRDALFFSRHEVNAAVTRYYKALPEAPGVRRDSVQLDAVLAAALRERPGASSRSAPDGVPEALRLRKGLPRPVAVATERRHGNKHVTTVEGLEAYGVDPSAVAEELQYVAAAAATTQALERGAQAAQQQGAVPWVQVQIMGDCRDRLAPLVAGAPARELRGRDALFFSRHEVNAAVTRYYKALPEAPGVRRDSVQLDAVLAAALRERPGAVVEKRAVCERALASLQAWHVINRDDVPEALRLRKGLPRPVAVATERRHGNKHVTTVEGLEAYGVDPSAVAEELQYVAAAAATTQALERGAQAAQQQGAVPWVQVQIMGDCRDLVVEHLVQKHRIPKKLISTK
eukprot:m51a1_g8094 hypothetical protein (703) ;mRNA; r:61828-65654